MGPASRFFGVPKASLLTAPCSEVGIIDLFTVIIIFRIDARPSAAGADAYVIFTAKTIDTALLQLTAEMVSAYNIILCDQLII